MSERIEVIISPTGETTVRVVCGQGQGCKALTAKLEAALGTTTSDALLPEYHRQGATQKAGAR